MENKESLDIQYMRTKLLKAIGVEEGDNIYQSKRFPLEHLVDNVCRYLNLCEIWMLEIRRLVAYRYGEAPKVLTGNPEDIYRMVRDEFRRLEEFKRFSELSDVRIAMNGELKGEPSKEELEVIGKVLSQCYGLNCYSIVVGNSPEEVQNACDDIKRLQER